MKMKVLMCCLTSCLAFATLAEAQPGGGGGRRGGGPGGGGFGRTSIFTVAGNDDAQKDIGITTDEATKVKAVVDEFNEANRDAMRSAGENVNFREMTPEQREKFNEKVAESNKTNVEKFLPKLKDVLSADQFTRLQQITWQAMGSSAFTEAEIIKALNITSDQQSKIKSIRTDYDAKSREVMQAAFANGGGGGGGGGGGAAFAEVREKTQAINKERDGKVDEVLTKEQLDKFASLVGKKFDVEKLRTGRGPGGGGPGGGGGGKGKRPQPKAE